MCESVLITVVICHNVVLRTPFYGSYQVSIIYETNFEQLNQNDCTRTQRRYMVRNLVAMFQMTHMLIYDQTKVACSALCQRRHELLASLI